MSVPVTASAGAALSLAQITAQLDAVLGRDADARAVAIRAASRGDWPEVLRRRGRSFAIQWCESGLALREALLSLEAQPQSLDGLVLLTPLADTAIPADVAARLARGRVFQPKGWDLLRQQFGVHSMDARLDRYDWMPQVLTEVAGAEGFAPVPSGFLDLDTAWREVLSRVLQIEHWPPDPAALMAWALRADVEILLGRLLPRARTDVLAWLGSSAGAAGKWVVRCIEVGRAGDAAAIGLVCDVLFSPRGEGQTELAQAAVRLERYVGDRHIGIQDGREWAVHARRFVDGMSLETARLILDRADQLLQELRIAEWAHLAGSSPAGLDQRLQRFAEAVESFVAKRSDAGAAEVEDSANAVLAHGLIGEQPLRAERVRMARRLVRWLVRAPAAGSGLDAFAAVYADEGAFVDRARYKLLGGDSLSSVTHAMARLRGAALEQCEAGNRGFASALASAVREAAPCTGRAMPVESVLEKIVVPLAAVHPVLLLVVDGLSLSIFRELFERSERLGWVEWMPETADRPLVGLAAFPTVTEVSRHSLFAGRVSAGAAASEKSIFATRSDLLAVSSSSLPPRLFHKGDLSTDGGLAPEVRSALVNPSQKIVGVVFNAVDDHLAGPDQLETQWSLDSMRLLMPLLSEARAGRRALVVTADHGHVLEDSSTQISGGSSDRWRSGCKASTSSEVVLSGPRVLTAEGETSVVCLWSETARYTGRKNGYHGGASPAEVLVPLSVFAPNAVNLPGWKLAPPQLPEWWDTPNVVATPQVIAPASAKPSRKAAAAAERQAGLFGSDELPFRATPPSQVDWTRTLIESSVYASQKQLAARVALPDTQMQALLLALSERGGKLGRAAIAQRLGLPELRMSGLLSAARRILNVDQASVLAVDEMSGMVELNQQLLFQQFQLFMPRETR